MSVRFSYPVGKAREIVKTKRPCRSFEASGNVALMLIEAASLAVVAFGAMVFDRDSDRAIQINANAENGA